MAKRMLKIFMKGPKETMGKEPSRECGAVGEAWLGTSRHRRGKAKLCRVREERRDAAEAEWRRPVLSECARSKAVA